MAFDLTNSPLPPLPYYPSRSLRYRQIKYRINLAKYGMDYFVQSANRWRKKNPQKLRASWTKYNMKEESKLRRKLWYFGNKERVSSQKKIQYVVNKEKIKQRCHDYYERKRVLIQMKTSNYYQNWKVYNKKIAIFHYTDGKMCCKNCGEDILDFLTIDHINGGGIQHRKSIGSRNIHVWLRKNNFPDGFQVLCYNCNCSKSRTTDKRYGEIVKELQQRQLFLNMKNGVDGLLR